MRAVILDTGVANLSSLAFAVKRLGVEPIITREAAEIRAADRIFLPGRSNPLPLHEGPSRDGRHRGARPCGPHP